MQELDATIEQISDEFEGLTTAREATLARTRKLIRLCANTIRAIHRQEWENAQDGLAKAKEVVTDLIAEVEPYPELYHSGYTQDSLREFAEANLTYVLVRGEPIPSHTDLNIQPATYLNGLAEAATELRRHILDIIRHQHNIEAERMLEAMDSIYSHLITIDYTDKITHGLRRRTDVLRNVLERTRGDLTTSLRQQQLQDALQALEKKIGIE